MKNKTIFIVALLVFVIFSLGSSPVGFGDEPVTNYDYWIGINRLIDMFVDTRFATGLDVSKHRGDLKWNLEDERISEIIDFVIIRAGYVGYESGEITTDEHFENNYIFLEQQPQVLRGTYWYHTSNKDWQSQFEYFTNLIDDRDFDFIALDFEEIYNEMSEEFGKATKDFLLALQEKYPNKKVFIYTHKYHYNDWLAKYPELATFPYWSADYPTRHWVNLHQYPMQKWLKRSLSTREPQMPEARMNDDWDIWQFGDKTGMGEILGLETLNVDMNRSRLNYNDFVNFIGVPERWESNNIYKETTIVNNPSRLEFMHNDLAEIYILSEAKENQCSYFIFDKLILCDGYPCQMMMSYDIIKENNVAFIENEFYLRSDRVNTTYDQTINFRYEINIVNQTVLEKNANGNYIDQMSMEYEGERFDDRYFMLYLDDPAYVKSEVLICEVNDG